MHYEGISDLHVAVAAYRGIVHDGPSTAVSVSYTIQHSIANCLYWTVCNPISAQGLSTIGGVKFVIAAGLCAVEQVKGSVSTALHVCMIRNVRVKNGLYCNRHWK